VDIARLTGAHWQTLVMSRCPLSVRCATLGECRQIDRPPSHSTAASRSSGCSRRIRRNCPITEIAKQLGVSRPIVYRLIRPLLEYRFSRKGRQSVPTRRWPRGAGT